MGNRIALSNFKPLKPLDAAFQNDVTLASRCHSAAPDSAGFALTGSENKRSTEKSQRRHAGVTLKIERAFAHCEMEI